MPGLPSGIVTMLFSDIEGSTLLLQRLGQLWAPTLDDQRRLLRSAWRAHDGVELGTEGDSFFVVFERADAAVSAALAGQDAMARHEWPNGERVRVRMGIHTGAPLQHDDGYVGIDVHRAARIAAAAHGGQIVVSGATHDAVTTPVDMTDLGLHYLRDIPGAERLFQASGIGQEGTFPPLKSLGTTSSLPTTDTELVGRDGELAELTALVTTEGARLVTLTGPGGSGKTRLSIGLARSLAEQPTRFPDGVFFVPLVDVASGDGMWAKIGEVLDFPAAQRAADALLPELATWRALLILDNLEQIAGADAVVGELIERVRLTTLVATSRVPLHLVAEHEHAVPPLELPESSSLEDVEGSGAAQMFQQRARRVRADFAITQANAGDVAAICRRLDGLPLALELAAARSKVLSARAILGRLDSALDLTSPSARTPDRHRTLRGTIDWSYRLLSPGQQALFRGLGIFAGGADLAAVEAVASDGGSPDVFSILTDLVDASLVVVSESGDGEPRFGLLETIRAFALDLLARVGELTTVQDRHLHHFASVAARLGDQYDGPRYAEVMASFEKDFDNLKQAFDWARALAPAAGDRRHGDALEIGVWTSAFLQQTRGHAEATPWLAAVCDLSGNADHPLHAQALWMLATGEVRIGEPTAALAHARQSVDMGRRLGDDVGLGIALATAANIELELDGAEASRPTAVESLEVARRSDDPRALYSALMAMLAVDMETRDFEAGHDVVSEMDRVVRHLNDPSRILEVQQAFAWITQGLGRPVEAMAWMEKCVRSTLALGPAYKHALAAICYDYVTILIDLGDVLGAARLLGATDAERERECWERTRSEIDDFAVFLAKAHDAVSDEDWDRVHAAGRAIGLREAVDSVDSWDRGQLRAASPH